MGSISTNQNPVLPTLGPGVIDASIDAIINSAMAMAGTTGSSGAATEYDGNYTVAEQGLLTELFQSSILYGLDPGELLDLVSAKLTNMINGEGYGLDPQDEADIWNRARDRETYNSQLAMEEVNRNYSLSGLSLPPGAMIHALYKATSQAVEKNSSVNRDLAIKKVELYWEAKKTVLQFAIALRQAVMNAQAEITKSNASIDTATIDANAKVTVGKFDLEGRMIATQAEFAKANAQVQVAGIESTARVTAAALSILNVNASVSYSYNRSASQSVSASTNYSSSDSNSYSESFNTNQNYNHEES